MEAAAEPTHVIITVVRTGGIAGLRREWRVEPDPRDAPHWRQLIDGCPWVDATGRSPGADRYVWSIRARLDDRPERSAELGDAQIDGPWRVLVDEVRAAAPRRSRVSRTGDAS